MFLVHYIVCMQEFIEGKNIFLAFMSRSRDIFYKVILANYSQLVFPNFLIENLEFGVNMICLVLYEWIQLIPHLESFFHFMTMIQKWSTWLEKAWTSLYRVLVKAILWSNDTGILMSHWCHTMIDGAEFWISCQRIRMLRKVSHWQLIQNLVQSTIVWRQCDIRIAIKRLYTT